MSDLDLCYMSAEEALRRFKDRSLSPVEVLKAQIARAEATEPKINALCDTYYEEALEAAKEAEERYGKTDGHVRPLEGLTCVIKDEIKLKGRRTTAGSLIYKDRIDDETDIMAERLIDAGAIVHARSTTPEFCLLGITKSRIWGVSRNPHNPQFTPGGSSGGTGASLAAGSSTLGTGTDIGGSIRIPAGCCGIMGLKASYGRIPEAPVFNLDFYSHSGPMTRTVNDAALMFNQVVGPTPKDIVSLRDEMQISLDQKPIKGWRVAYSLDFGFFELDEDVRRNTLAALDALRDMGCTVEEITVPWGEHCEKATRDYLNIVWGQHMKRLYDDHRDEMTDYAARSVEEAAKSTIEDYTRSLEIAWEVYHDFGSKMETYDIFICPTNAVPAIDADHDPWDDNFQINGRLMDPEYGWVMTHPFNMMSRCPVMSVPTGKAQNGVPTSVQVVGKTYDEPAVFQAASTLETAFGFQRPNL